ncbi:SusC/RagA family TonB-linked outer membrane protein [Sinomicrobium soli]|uniref:SusC/RagA family TonB-linked outer membrane protein n=1 Tax=Sinomicrobium sp. N-1-3-6 TaxID=2219864 RepID=UPI000DCD1995|nr:SusC/RagA family TonB-linked outer membrane protein [Sinomicrobium sp. N-1-3-6]RAV28945.1 SusC/RagA family TonB-linked outer membrane protein [Sinomicrobium sp. N-1-3-6]
MKKILSGEILRFFQRYERPIILIMKRSLFLCFILFFNFTAFAFSQKVTLNLGEVTIYEALKEIRKLTDTDFFYSDEELDVNQVVRVHFDNVDLVEAVSSLVGHNFRVEEQGDRLFLIVPSEDREAQDFIVKGMVTDENGTPLPGVTVIIMKERRGTTTDFDGKYEIRASAGTVFSFSYVGYVTREVTVEGTRLDVQLQPDVSELDEVVVTGIVERKKETFTGAVRSISGEELKAVGNRNVIESIKTLDPSFIVMENNIQGANPNVLPTIEIRGQTSVSTDGLRDEYGADPNSPLFILDGFETDLQSIVDLNMNRVASITILKDAASTALYGSKAANGVVVVETKQPKPGRVNITYTGDFSVDIPDLSDYNLMNAAEKLEFERLAGRYTYGGGYNPNTQVWLDSLYNAKLEEVRRGVDTYWLNEPTRTGITQTHSVRADGGNEEIRFGVDINYRKQEGVMKGSARETWGGNIDLTYRKGKLNISNRLYVNGSEADESPYGAFADFARASPYYRKRNEFGEAPKYLEEEAWIEGWRTYKVTNPLYRATVANTDNNKGFNLRNNLNAIWTIDESLRLQGGIQLRKGTTEHQIFAAPENAEFDDVSYLEKGRYTNTRGNTFSYMANAMLIWHKVLNEKHTVNLNLRADIEEQNSKGESYTAVGFPMGSNGNPNFSISYEPDAKPYYYSNIYRRNNILGSVNYSYADKYFLDANYRLDGSTAFGSNKQYEPFWAIGLGWNLHKEIQMDKSIVNILRLRQTLGYTGNQNMGSVASTSVYSYGSVNNYFGNAIRIGTLGNPDLEWQKTFDTNFGLDIAMFENRLDGQINLFTKKTKPLVVPVNLASSTGLVAYPLNVGELRVNGIEAILNFRPVYDLEKQVIWRVGITALIQDMEYRDVGNALRNLDEDALESGSLRRFRDGANPDDIWAVPSLGIDPATGREVFLKKNGKTTFDHNYEDEVIVGNTRPDVEGVISTSFTYKGFNLGINMRYRVGGQLFNGALYNKVENIGQQEITWNQDRRALYDRWQQPGDQARFKGISISRNTPISSRFVQDNNNIVGESFNLGYNVYNKPWLETLGIESLRLTAYMNDIFRISSVRVERGIDYPFARTVSFSINASF